MSSIPYLWVPITALICYMLLFSTLFHASKQSSVRSYCRELLCFVVWTGGSMLMRMFTWPGAMFWYEVSLGALFCLPAFLYLFLYDLSQHKRPKEKLFVYLLTFFTVVPAIFDVYLDKPILEMNEASQMVFHYHIDARVIIPIVLCILILILALRLVWHQIHATGYSLILAGMVLLAIGNMISVLPSNVFPFDTLAGIINAGLVFWALYKRKLFDLHIFFSTTSINMITGALLCVLAMPITKSLQHLITYWVGAEHIVSFLPIFWLLAVVFTILFNQLLTTIVHTCFLGKEKQQSFILKEFSATITHNPSIEELCEKLIASVNTIYGKRPLCLFLLDSKRNVFLPMYPKELQDIVQPIQKEDPCTQWFSKQQESIYVKQLQGSGLMPATDKIEMMEAYHIQCIVPFRSEQSLQGILFMGSDDPHQKYTKDDLLFLNSLGSIMSVGIKNAHLYQKLLYEARIDPLTDLLNRRAFASILHEALETQAQFALVMMDLDDFKLYNQLYGSVEGDHMLQKLAALLRKESQSDAIIARYAGKVFTLLLPNATGKDGVNFTEHIRKWMDNEDFQTLYRLTFSCGVYGYHGEEVSADQLLEYVDMAVFEAKQSGKNHTCLYDDRKTKKKPETTIDSTSTIYAITAAIDAKDHYTFSHSQNVANYAKALAEAIGLDDFHVQMIYQAGLVHDVGKLAIPEHILSKPGLLSEEEFEIMKSHVESSVPIIRNLPSLDYVLPSAITHLSLIHI